MAAITFENLKSAWDRLKTERSAELRRLSPNLSTPEEITLRRTGEDEGSLTVQFSGFENATDDVNYVPQVKRLVLLWLRKISDDIRTMRSDPDSLIVKMDKGSKVEEASIGVFKRDPKTNTRKNYYKCIGGLKNGKKVSSPDKCVGAPDFKKKTKMKMTKRAKSGQMGMGRRKTQLTNIVSKKIRKANTRFKKARGF